MDSSSKSKVALEERERLALLSILEDERQGRLILKQQEERYRTLVESLNDGLIQVDNEDRVLFVNSRFCQMTGYEAGELLGRIGHEMLFDVELGEDIKRRNQERLSGVSEQYEIKLLRKDGQHLWVRVSAAPVYNAQKKVIGSIGLFTDITREKEVKARAEALEHRYQLFVNATQDLTFLKDAEFRYLMVNEANQKFFGRPLDDILGKTDFDLMTPEQAEACRRSDRQAVEEERLVISEETVEGTIYETRKFPVRLEDGRIGVGGIGRDITDRRRFEQLLLESSTNWRTTFDAIKDGVCLLSPDQKALRCNLAFARHLGREFKDVIGQHCYELIHPQGSPPAECPFARMVQSRQRETMEMSVNGRSFEVLVDPIFNEKGELTGAVHIMSEITERKKMVSDLRESEERFRTFFENTFVGIYRTTPDRLVLMANPALVRMLGYRDFNELAQRDLEQDGFEPGYLREEFKRLMAQADQVIGHEAPWRRKDGGVIWVRENARCVRDEKGEVLYYEGTAEDITERKKIEEQLDQAMEIARLGYWEYDVASDTFTFNDHFYRMLRTSVDKVGSYKMRSAEYAQRFLPAKEMYLVGETVRQTLEDENAKSPYQMEHRVVFGDGEIGYISVTSYIVRDNKNRTIRTYGVNQDISARRRAEQALRESEERYRLLVESLNEVIFSVSLDGEITYMSPVVEKLTNYKTHELIGRKFSEFIHPDDLADLQTKIKMSLSGVSEPSVFRVLDKGGRIIYFRGSSRPVMKGGLAIGLTGTMADVTQQVKLEEEKQQVEEELRQAQKMEAIGQLAGGVAHDFNNMLAAILGNAELLLKRLAQNPEQARLAEQIVTGAEHAAGLTRQLLTFSRKSQLQKAPLDIHRVIAETAGILANTIDRRISIEQHLRAAPSTVLGDQSQLENALLNLGLNSRDAMPQGGRLIFSTETVHLDKDYIDQHRCQMAPGRYIKIEVTDTGAGIAPEVRARIFEPFFTTKEPGKGTGLGLASAYGAVRGHGGTIECYSEPGHGTTMKIYLQVQETGVVAEAAPGAETAEEGKATGTILVVDDEELVRGMTERLLRSQGYDVLSCGNPEEAVLVFQAWHEKIGLVILDMIMPKMSGREVFLEMKKIDPGIKAILSSGFSEDSEAREILKLGIIGFVQKPFRAADLLAMVRKAIR